MLCELKQTVSALYAEFVLLAGGAPVGDALFPNNFLFGGPCVCHYYNTEYTLTYCPAPGHNLSRSVQEREYVPYAIAQNGAACGQICAKQTGGFLSRYGYVAMDLFGMQYEMFEVGLGSEGIVWPIYLNGRQVAQLGKPTTVHNNLDEYEICALDRQSELAAYLMSLYLDARSYARRGQITAASVQKTFLLTTNKKLKAKYDPTFRERAVHA